MKTAPALLRFGEFELDAGNFMLRRRGQSVRIERTALELLLLLTERPAELITFDQAADRLWGDGVHVAVGPALYTAIKKIRRALGDSARRPQYVSTVARKGYRFIAPLRRARLPAESAAPSPPLLAVLPFRDRGARQAPPGFAEAMSEDLITELGRLAAHNLGIVARTSSLRYRSSRLNPGEIGRQLGAEYLITGSVRRRPSRVEVAVQLVRAADATEIWAAGFTRPLAELRRLQREIACAVAGEIRLKTAPGVGDPPELDPELYDQFLHARVLQRKLVLPAMRQAIARLRALLERAPGFAPAWSALAECYARLPITSDVRPSDAFPHARAAAEHALELDPGLGSAYAVRAGERFWHAWNWAGAEADTVAAEACNPSLPEAYLYRAHLHSNLGRHDAALAEIARARRLDPFSPIIGTLAGGFHYHAGERLYAKADRLLCDALLLAPGFWVAHVYRAKLLGIQHRTAGALAAAALADRSSGHNGEATALAGWTLARCGRRREARQKLRALERRADQGYVPPLHPALILAGLEEREACLDRLEQGWAERDVRLTFLHVERRWNPLRATSRFQSLLTRMHLPLRQP